MHHLVGDAVLDIKYYWTIDAEIDGIPVVLSRTGWTGEVGYEVILLNPSRGDDLWETIMEAGRPHDIRPIASCEARRIEAGVFNDNSDMTIDNNLFEVTGLERLVEEQESDYVGKDALIRIKNGGVKRKLVGCRSTWPKQVLRSRSRIRMAIEFPARRPRSRSSIPESGSRHPRGRAGWDHRRARTAVGSRAGP